MHGGRRQYGSKQPSKLALKSACVAMLTMRASLDGVEPETLVRCYGLSLPDATDLLASERKRRAA